MVTENELCVSTELENLGDIADFVGDCAAQAGLSEEAIYDVQMAVDEACTNSIQHAYAGCRDGELWICCFVEDDDFVVRITDFGTPFDPQSVPQPDITTPLEDRAVGGLGLFFMHRLMDSVRFTSSQKEGNQVVMRKRRHDSRA